MSADTETNVRTCLELAWNSALGTSQTYTDDDDFFELGGHSVLALHVADELEEALGQPVSLRVLLASSRFGDVVAALTPSGSSADQVASTTNPSSPMRAAPSSST